jgi:thioredoxin reductase (NADPH)
MAEPVLVVVDDEDASLQVLARELHQRYGASYRVVASSSAADGLRRLADLRAEGAQVPLILADQWMPGMTGTQLLARARELHPAARRGLLTSWGDQSALAPIPEAVALGQLEFYVPKPTWSPDEQFHRAITESLDQWWRQQDVGRFEAVTLVAHDPSARAHEIRDLLTRNNIPFGFVRTDSAEGRAALDRLGVREASGPVVALYTGAVLVDPSNVEVAEALGTAVRPPETAYDVIIVGAGPAGLAAAVYAASEGLSTALLEHEAFGGQAGTSSLIRNYLGFPHGVSGTELAGRAWQQAWQFGVHLVYGNPVISLAEEGAARVLTLQDGSEVRSRAVVLATGVSYRRLQAPGLESLAGAGVFYGAATVEARAMAGKPVLVVGGGNSAGQAALHLSKYASTVTILVRSHSLAASMSQYLIREIDSAANVDVRYHAEVAGAGGEERLQHVDLRDRDTGKAERASAAGLFILIGAEPHTGWLSHTVACDRWGYILTGPDTGERWQQPRPPLLLETSMPGVFAVGDVRHGSVKRVASAVGEGSIAIRLVHEYSATPHAQADRLS